MRRAKKLTTEPERFFRDSRYGVVRNIGKLIW